MSVVINTTNTANNINTTNTANNTNNENTENNINTLNNENTAMNNQHHIIYRNSNIQLLTLPSFTNH